MFYICSFEDAVRQLLGQNAYIAYTMDKLVQQMVKCLQAMAADETVTKLIGVFVYHRSKPEPVVPKLYQAHVAQLLLNSAEEVYRMQLVVDADELARGTGTSTIACGALAHLHTINASTVTDMGEALELDDAEDEEEAAAEEAVKLLSTTSEDAHVTEELEHLNENDGGEADNDDDEDLEDDDIELEMDHHQSQGEDQADSEDGESDMGVQDTENMMELENEAHSRAKRSRR